MVGLKINFDLFLDRKEVAQRVGRGKVKALRKIGRFLRTSARRSIRRSKKSSKPGQPPRTRRGEDRLKRIFYVYDPGSESVVVGPIKFGKSNVLELLEFGGRQFRKKKKSATYKPRPFMGPALAKERKNDKLASAFKEVL